MIAPSGHSKEALAAAREIVKRMKATFPEIEDAYDPNWEIPVAAIIDKHMPVSELRECLREARRQL